MARDRDQIRDRPRDQIRDRGGLPLRIAEALASDRGAPRRRCPWITMAGVEERIRTDRLELSPVVPDDVPAIAALRMDPDVRRFLGGVLDVQVAEERARSVVGTTGYWAVRMAGGSSIAGLISLTS